MQKIEKYNPFNTKEYEIFYKNGKKYLIFNNQLIEICPTGYIPKSGLLFDEVLTSSICENKSILDLGCGYLGIISLIAKKNNAKNVDAIDYDSNCVRWFNKIIQDNNYTNIKCFESNYFEKIHEKYDLIIANPPQMPMKNISLHDSGGLDGRQHIIKIIKESIDYLNVKGELYLIVFDFIGVTKRTNKEKRSVIELAEEYGYSTSQIIYEIPKLIKENSVTYNNLEYISSIYPEYNWGENNKKCNMQILKLRK